MKFIVNDDGHIDVNFRGLSFKLGIDDFGTRLKPGIEVEIDDKILDATLSVVTADTQEFLNKQKRSISMRCVTPVRYDWTKEKASQFVFDHVFEAYKEYGKDELAQLVMEMQGLSETKALSETANVMFECTDDPKLKSAMDFLLLVEFTESEHNK